MLRSELCPMHSYHYKPERVSLKPPGGYDIAVFRLGVLRPVICLILLAFGMNVSGKGDHQPMIQQWIADPGFIPMHVGASQDTVRFVYLSGAAGEGYLDVSVGNSDQTITSMDFSLKIDPSILEYDSLIILRPYLTDAIAHYREADSTLRFSSFSFNPYEEDLTLVRVRFREKVPVSSMAFLKVSAFVNGDGCEESLEVLYTGTHEADEDVAVACWPNPADKILFVRNELAGSKFVILDACGKLISTGILEGHGLTEIDVHDLANGMHLIQFMSDYQTIVFKVVIDHNP
ncbi:MAG: T9SS type A sorting domain-containing protein [Bacteroidales bacterium]|nr:T9SS type A sorting domain-containing protein [Bacteroidales bacterium]